MTTESKGEKMTTSQEIIATDFGGKFPTLDDIVTKFPPKEEKFGTGENIFSRMVSRSSKGTILYSVPPEAAQAK